MADPKVNSLITQEQIDAAQGSSSDGEKPVTISPGRVLRSRVNAAFFPGAAGGDA